jgi:DNA helicase HerA-like ATPase
MADPILIAKGETELFLLPQMANRHGLIAGATGTGKTVSLQVLAEGLSRAGVSVFMADVKGDLAGISQPGSDSNEKVKERVELLKLRDFKYEGFPIIPWDIHQIQGHPVRTTVIEIGPVILSRLFDLNETQSGVLSIVFEIADDHKMDLLDLKDLQAMLQFVGSNAQQFQLQYGHISGASVGAIQRAILVLQQQGGDSFFGEPALNPQKMIGTGGDGRGFINILDCQQLILTPKTYAAFLFWFLSELYEGLPEVGDLEKPKLVFFFEEAHLLFAGASKPFLERVEQVVRIVRSKGVGIFFVTHNPLDIPPVIRGQLSNRIQHALRAYTPQDQKAVRAAAQTFRTNPSLNVEEAITQLRVGEALVSMLDAKGVPGVVQRALMLPPRSQIGPIAPQVRQQIMNTSPFAGAYEKALDRNSAFEILQARTAGTAAGAGPEADQSATKGQRKKPEPTAFEAISKNTMVRQVARTAAREVARGLMGVLLGTRRS